MLPVARYTNHILMAVCAGSQVNKTFSNGTGPVASLLMADQIVITPDVEILRAETIRGRKSGSSGYRTF